MDEAWAVQKSVGFPTVIRPSFTLGGTGGGIAYNPEEFETICKRGLEASPTNELGGNPMPVAYTHLDVYKRQCSNFPNFVGPPGCSP